MQLSDHTRSEQCYRDVSDLKVEEGQVAVDAGPMAGGGGRCPAVVAGGRKPDGEGSSGDEWL